MKSALKLLLISAALFTASCNDPKEPAIPYREGAVVLLVNGMHCSNCEGTIETSLSKIEGIEWARAENGLAQVAYTGSASRETVVAAIKEAGFEVTQ